MIILTSVDGEADDGDCESDCAKGTEGIEPAEGMNVWHLRQEQLRHPKDDDELL